MMLEILILILFGIVEWLMWLSVIPPTLLNNIITVWLSNHLQQLTFLQDQNL